MSRAINTRSGKTQAPHDQGGRPSHGGNGHAAKLVCMCRGLCTSACIISTQGPFSTGHLCRRAAARAGCGHGSRGCEELRACKAGCRAELARQAAGLFRVAPQLCIVAPVPGLEMKLGGGRSRGFRTARTSRGGARISIPRLRFQGWILVRGTPCRSRAPSRFPVAGPRREPAGYGAS